VRRLEIGPKKGRIPGFETLDIVKSPIVDHVGDCRKTPFRDATFDLVYSCHVIEHIEQFDVEATIAEWARILKPGGWLEVHTLNAERLMRALLHLDETGEWTGPTPGTWRQEQHKGDPYLWSAIRIMNYPKGGSVYQMHRALITPNFLKRCFERAGLVDLESLTRDDMRGSRHPEFINLGLKGRKG
jgi:SAM-dependent methyltransferase